MALSNTEYNNIMREYEERRYEAVHGREERQREIYEKIPRVREIQDEISSVSVANMKNRIFGVSEGDNCTGAQLHGRIEALVEEKHRLLRENGYPEDYMKPVYACSQCCDTGYVGTEKCGCLKRRITEFLYSRSNLKDVLARENFTTFDINLYSKTFRDKATGMSAYDNMAEVVKKCREFIEGFEDTSDNFFIYGESGAGKTFLTNCIAKELMDRAYSVIYMSAVHMFDVLSEEQFDSRGKEREATADILNCDLLIIDDLGTEMVNTFTASSLFNCINERMLKKKPVIISTNLSLGAVRDIYSERVFSRIASGYKLIKIFGEDLRMKLWH